MFAGAPPSVGLTVTCGPVVGINRLAIVPLLLGLTGSGSGALIRSLWGRKFCGSSVWTDVGLPGRSADSRWGGVSWITV